MTEFTGKNKKELFKTMADKRQALQDFRFGVSGGKAKNVKLGRTIRKDIARIQTEISIQNRAGLPTTAASKMTAPRRSQLPDREPNDDGFVARRQQNHE